MLTGTRLSRVITYDPNTGLFTRVRGSGGRANSSLAGTQTERYVKLRIYGVMYKAHHIAWLWMTGAWPTLDVDHIDGDGRNNRWNNLRLATCSQNCANKRRQMNNTSGFKGVTKAQFGRWQAQTKYQGKKVYLGVYATREEAHAAYCRKMKSLFGDFARFE